MLPDLSDEHVQTLVDITQGWTDDPDRPPEDDETRAAIAQGMAEANRGEFATDAAVEEAFKRFRG